jgi:uncharacterized DUF497 family protein
MNRGLFEWDESKSESNLTKHGLSFDDGTALWMDPLLLRLRSRSDHLTEPRFLYIGRIELKVWVAITTIRDDRIRIISIRRARQNEVKLYEKEV